MTDELKPRGIWQSWRRGWPQRQRPSRESPTSPGGLGQHIISKRPIPQEAVDAYLAWEKGNMSYAAMAEIVTDCLMEIIAPLVDCEDPNLINFRTGLSLGFFERVADGVREITGLPITGEAIKDGVLKQPLTGGAR